MRWRNICVVKKEEVELKKNLFSGTNKGIGEITLNRREYTETEKLSRLALGLYLWNGRCLHKMYSQGTVGP